MKIVELERTEILERVKHENDLIHQRMSWLGTFQGLLFGAVAFAWKEASAGLLVYIASAIGFLVSISIWYGIYRANLSLRNAVDYWDRIKPSQFQGLDAEGFRTSKSIYWLMPGYFIPTVFALSWMAVYLVRFTT